ncbi:MAG: beta-propeller domain-containing protein [Coriobacteriia bacterium]|nr:beta-propeller domain-containing protein [Coriobacteriia bacterium]
MTENKHENNNENNNENTNEITQPNSAFDVRLRTTAQEMREQMRPSDELVQKTIAAIQAADQVNEQTQTLVSEQAPPPHMAVDALPVIATPQNQRLRKRRGRAIGALAAAAAAVFVIVGGFAVTNQFMTGLDNSENFDIAQPEQEAGSSSSLAGIATPGSYSEVYDVLRKLSLDGGSYGPSIMLDDSASIPLPNTSMPQTATAESSTPLATMGRGEGAVAGSFSETNTQVAGIDEADVVKTDGKNIFALHGNEILIYAANGRDTKALGSVKINLGQPQDFYIAGDCLVVMLYSTMVQGYYYIPQYYVSIYNISKPSAPQLINSLGQDGDLSNSRLVDGMLYLVSAHTVWGDRIEQQDPATYVPRLFEGSTESLDAMQESAKPFDPEHIRIMPDISSARFTVVSAVDIKSASRVSELSLLGNTTTIYMNHQNLFLATTQYSTPQFMMLLPDENISPRASTTTDSPADTQWDEGPVTRISRIALSGGTVDLAASTVIKGELLNQFSLDEHAGYLRVAITERKKVSSIVLDGELVDGVDTLFVSTNSLLVLDDQLNVAGSIENMAPGEQIYSARFDGEVGYMVTFRQVDPLFSLDLSDPKNPRVMDELKIPGFSQYLHLYKDGRLFGLGRETTDDGALTGNLKLSMFDVSNPFDLSELHTLPVTALGAEALHNHKALLIDAAKNIIGFEVWSNASPSVNPAAALMPGSNEYFGSLYMIFGYDDKSGFNVRATIPVKTEYLLSPFTRALYISDYLYVINGNHLGVYNLDTLQEITWINFYS